MLRSITQSEAYLLRRIASGDEDAFRKIYGRCQGPLYRFLLHMSGNLAIAEDITQEVFMTLIRDTNRFDPARGTLRAYLLGIGRNLLLRRMVRERVFVRFPGGLGNESAELGEKEVHPELIVAAVDPVRTETIGRVRRAVLSLPTNYREVVVLCDLQEMSYEEAATVLACAVGTVRSRLHRGRNLLVEKLREFRKSGAEAASARPAVRKRS